MDLDYRESHAPSIHAALDLLAFGRPSWHRRATCRGMGTALFFPEVGHSTTDAKAICARCPVAGECRADAHGDVNTVGVWAGEATGTRRKARTTERAA